MQHRNLLLLIAAGLLTLGASCSPDAIKNSAEQTFTNAADAAQERAQDLAEDEAKTLVNTAVDAATNAAQKVAP